jgi:hypothetical protein
VESLNRLLKGSALQKTLVSGLHANRVCGAQASERASGTSALPHVRLTPLLACAAASGLLLQVMKLQQKQQQQQGTAQPAA